MVIGVTGGVGVGKSQLMEFFKKECQADVLLADDAAKEVMEPEGEAYPALVEEFVKKEGLSLLTPSGGIDRKALARVVVVMPSSVLR